MDLIPCEICERTVPFEGYSEHITRCLRATQIARFLMHHVRVRVPSQPQADESGEEADDEGEDLSRHSQVSRVSLHDFIQNHFQHRADNGGVESQQGAGQRSAVIWFNIAARSQSYESNIRIGESLGNVHVGLKEDQLEQVAYSTNSREDLCIAEDDACAVCQERLSAKSPDEKLCLLACGHAYCDDCIRQWLQKSKKCPVCMVDLEDAYCWGR